MKGGSAGLGANNPSVIGREQHQRNFEEIVSARNGGRRVALEC
jgi:hypothetical protein